MFAFGPRPWSAQGLLSAFINTLSCDVPIQKLHFEKSQEAEKRAFLQRQEEHFIRNQDITTDLHHAKLDEIPTQSECTEPTVSGAPLVLDLISYLHRGMRLSAG